MKAITIKTRPRTEDELKACLSSRAWRLSNLYHIINEMGHDVIYRPNHVQQLFHENQWYLNIILKSRQHGITTDRCIVALDMALFTPNVRAGIIAHNREDAEAFFRDKIKYAYDHLPESLRNSRAAKSNTARELMFSNNSAIRVGTSMRSATLQYLHISEFGKICRKYPDKAKEIVTGSLNTLHVGQQCTIESTAEGREGYFYDFCQQAIKAAALGQPLTPLDFRFHFFPWFLDPRNSLSRGEIIFPEPIKTYFSELYEKHHISLTNGQKLWYYKKWAIQGDEMKREHPSTPEEAFNTTIQGAYYASEFTRIYNEGRICRVPVEDLPVFTFWDLGLSDSMAIWFLQKAGLEYRFIDYMEGSGEGLPYYIKALQDKKYIYAQHWGPHDLNVRELGTGKTRLELASSLGINFHTAPNIPVVDGISAVRSVLPSCWFDEERCARGISALENYRKEWDDKNGVYMSRPLHNWASNGADAFRYFAVSANQVSAGSGVMTATRARELYERYAPPIV